MVKNHSRKQSNKIKNHARKHNNIKSSEERKQDLEKPIDAFASFPDEIVVEILSRLPVKSHLRFRSICKKWRAIVDDSSFVDLHLNKSRTRPWVGRVLFSFSNLEGSKHYFYSSSLEGGKAALHVSLPGCNKGNKNTPCSCYVSESLNGIVLFYNGSNVYFCNPSTRGISTLPESSQINQLCSKLDKSFSVPYSSFSFGFDPETNEYKVLHIYATREGANSVKLNNVQCEVYTIKAEDPKEAKESAEDPKEPKESAKDPKEAKESEPKASVPLVSWRKISHVPPYPYMFRGKGVCVNGAIHWVGMRSPSDEVLVVFELSSERFRLISLPNGGVSSKSSLTQIGGRLAFLGYGDFDPSSIELWLLEDYDNLVWKKESFFCSQNQKKKGIKNLALVGNGYTGDSILIPSCLHEEFHVIPCRRGRKKFSLRTIRIDGLPYWTDSYGAKHVKFCVANHVESLVPCREILQNKSGESVQA